MVAGIAKLGTVEDLIQFTRLTRVDLVLVALPLTAEERVLEVGRKLWVLPVDVRLAAQSRPGAGPAPIPISVTSRCRLFDKPIADWNMAMKTLFVPSPEPGAALAGAGDGGSAVAIKLDSRGPVFFRRHRLGFNNEIIEFFSSVRSMTNTPTPRRGAGDKVDPRVTQVGRFIRKTLIDELPRC